MDDEELPRELAEYVPGETGATARARGERMRRLRAVIVVVAVVALVLPGVLVGISTASRTAMVACTVVAANEAPDATANEARFELGGPQGPGWYCYVSDFGGSELQLRFLGFIPEVRVVRG